jgi:YVTN family beta-propeller protein
MLANLQFGNNTLITNSITYNDTIKKQVIVTLPIKGGRSSLHKTLAVSLIISAMLIFLAVWTAQGTVAQTGDQLYVCNGNNVTVFNGTDLAGVRTIALGSNVVPGYIALSPDGTKAYIINAVGNQMLVVDTVSDATVHTIALAAPGDKNHSASSAIAVSPDGKRIYVSDFGAGVLRVIDASSYLIIANVSVGVAPIGLTLSTDGRFAYVANSGSGTVSVIDTSSSTVIGTATGGNGTFDVQLSPDGRRLYTSNWYGGDVGIYDAFNGTEIDKVQVNPWIGAGQSGIGNMRVSPDGKTIYVANAYDNTIVLINPDTRTIYKTIPVGQYPREVALSMNGSKLFVSMINDQAICSISLPSGNVTYRSLAPATPIGLALYSTSVLPTPVPVTIGTVTGTPVPTPSYAPTPVSTATPQPLFPPGTVFYPVTATPGPTMAPTVTETPEPTEKSYMPGWQAPDLGINISGDNAVILTIGGLALFLGVLGVIAYLSVRRKMRGPGNDDEDED